MNNQTGTTSLIAGALDKKVFASEQDRLEAYARALSVSVQAGSSIKGEKGDTGARGPRGERGQTGLRGPVGPQGQLETTIHDISVGEDQVLVSGDLRTGIFTLVYDDAVNPPPNPILYVQCIRYVAPNTVVYLSGTSPDGNYKLHVHKV